MKRLRPVDLAQGHGLSTQAVRNYEADGILPPAGRTASGYRIYEPRHDLALRAFVALVPAYGHAAATSIMRAVNTGDVEMALALVDDGHAQLRSDRETLTAVEQALQLLTGPHSTPAPIEDGLSIGTLAARLAVHPATLRKWEAAGLVQPRRDPRTGYRLYSAADVRDAQLVHQLRRGGYLLNQILPVLKHVRGAGGLDALTRTLSHWRHRLTARGLAMLTAAAALAQCLSDASRTWPLKAREAMPPFDRH